MDIRENFHDEPEEPLRAAFDGFKKDIWTALPVIVNKKSDGHTVSLKVAIKGQIKTEKGETKSVNYPLLEDVPVQFPGGGGKDENSTIFTHPVEEGDEGIVIFSSRPLDSWFESGGQQDAVDLRTHSLSDGMFIPGIRSKPRKIKNISTTTAQMRSVDGKHVVDLDPKKGTISASVDGGKHKFSLDKSKGASLESSIAVDLKAPKLNSDGNWNHKGGLRATGTIQSDQGLQGPILAGLPGDPPDVPENV